MMIEKMGKALRKNKKGFTLIELIVVIAILAILAAIAVPRIFGFQETARAQANKQMAVQVRNAMAMALANSEIEMASDAVDTYLVVTAAGTLDTTSSSASDSSANFNVDDATDAAEAATIVNGIIAKYIADFELVTVDGDPQIIIVRVVNTEVDTWTGDEGTTPADTLFD